MFLSNRVQLLLLLIHFMQHLGSLCDPFLVLPLILGLKLVIKLIASDYRHTLLKLSLCIIFLRILPTSCGRCYENILKVQQLKSNYLFSTIFQISCCFLNLFFSLSQLHFSSNLYLALIHDCTRKCGDGDLIKSELTAGNKISCSEVFAKSNFKIDQKH